MKHLSPKEKQHEAYWARKRWGKNLKRRGLNSGIVHQIVRIEPPRVMSFSENYDDTVSCMREIKLACATPTSQRFRNIVHIDFSTIERISTATALVLAAEIDRWRKIKGASLTPRDPSDWHPDVARILRDLGFFGLLDIEIPKELNFEGEQNEFTILPLVSCNTLDLEKIAQIEDHLRAVAATFRQDPSIYTALTEAAYNSIKHGYPKGHSYEFMPLRNQWWATGSWSPEQSRVKLIVYDQGVGIPETLPAWDHWEVAKDWLAKRHSLLSKVLKEHASVIEAALEVSRTSLTSGHGQGLKDVVSPVDVLKTGKVRILSGKGEVVYTHGAALKKTERTQHLGGTLIEWTIPVPKIVEAEGNGQDDSNR